MVRPDCGQLSICSVNKAHPAGRPPPPTKKIDRRLTFAVPERPLTPAAALGRHLNERNARLKRIETRCLAGHLHMGPDRSIDDRYWARRLRRISRRFCRALSRRNHDELSALEPRLGLVRSLWRCKELRARQCLHDLPPWSAGGQPTNKLCP